LGHKADNARAEEGSKHGKRFPQSFHEGYRRDKTRSVVIATILQEKKKKKEKEKKADKGEIETTDKEQRAVRRRAT